MKSFSYLFSLSIVLALTACSNPQGCDPDNMNFFSGMGCSVGGGYNHRSQNLQNQLSHEQQNAQIQQNTATQARNRETELQGQLDTRRDQLTKIDSQAWAVRKKLQEARANHSMTQQQLQRKEKQLDAYNAKRSQVSANPSEQDLKALSGILGEM